MGHAPFFNTHIMCLGGYLQYSGHLRFNKDGTIRPHDVETALLRSIPYLKAGTFMIELHNISKTYAKSGTKAVDSLTLQIPDGVIYGFLGPNGAGKTTTIRIMTGAIAADSGNVLIDGIDLDKNPIKAKQRFWSRPRHSRPVQQTQGIRILELRRGCLQGPFRGQDRNHRKTRSPFRAQRCPQIPHQQHEPGHAHETQPHREPRTQPPQLDSRRTDCRARSPCSLRT